MVNLFWKEKSKTNREIQFSINCNELGTDGFEVKWQDKKLVIAGGETRGTLYGAYDFLETLDCKFLPLTQKQ